MRTPQSTEASSTSIHSCAPESAAAVHYDSLVVLDEIGLVEAKDAATAVYQLAAGVGKSRMSRDCLPRPALAWCTPTLSTGEVPVASKLRENGQHLMAGQFVRPVDFAADAGKGYGVFDHPGETGSARELADKTKAAACTHFGRAGRAFVAPRRTAPTRVGAKSRCSWRSPRTSSNFTDDP